KGGTADLAERWMRRVDARDRAVLRKLVRECLGTGTSQAEYRYFHPQRGERWIYCRAGAVEESGRACIVGVSLDVTERRRAEEALKDVNRRKNQFLAMLGHELRNPLAPIRNAVQILGSLPAAHPKSSGRTKCSSVRLITSRDSWTTCSTWHARFAVRSFCRVRPCSCLSGCSTLSRLRSH